MANYFTCKLTVWGFENSMKEFYAVLNSDSTESPVEKFKMNKFVPIPEILFDESLVYEFSPVSVLKKSIKGRSQSIKVDSMGRTEEVFIDCVSFVEETCGTSSIEEWCENNWGCEEELEVIDIIRNEEIGYCGYCVKYNCVWTPNIVFVKRLHELFPELRFTLKYVSAEELVSETIVFEKKKVTIETHTYKNVCFKKLKDIDKFLFVSGYKEADYCVDIIGDNWSESLKDDGFTSYNVENWTEVMLHSR